MSARDIVMSAAGSAGDSKTYIEDVFSTYLYTGNGSTQTINNEIDLASKGGMVWFKGRNSTNDHVFTDTARGTSSQIGSNLTTAATIYTNALTAFNGNGFSLGARGIVNSYGTNFASWTFRKAPKFFDVVTYTGNGVAGRTISHSLGQAPGMIIVKGITGTYASGENWSVYHRSLGATKAMALNTPGVANPNSGFWFNTEPTSSVFTVGNSSNTNDSQTTYVAYLFAHDTTTDGLIRCGSFSPGGNLVHETLGWEPQFLLVKRTDTTGDWMLVDNMRGVTSTTDITKVKNVALNPNSSVSESASYGTDSFSISSTGFSSAENGTIIYMAIRRGPMRTPTDGTKVFKPFTGNTTNPYTVTSGFPPDTVICRDSKTGSKAPFWVDRLRGASKTAQQLLNSSATTPESLSSGRADLNSISDGWVVDQINTGYWGLGLRRAPGFFDVVVTSGGGVKKHNLGVAPELIIVKNRVATSNWYVVSKYGTYVDPFWDELYLNTTGSLLLAQGTVQNVTSTQFELFVGGSWNAVAYLFASCPGVSKVGSFTTTGESSIAVDCGFTNGARFVLIKRTDSADDWYVWDTARGIVAANDPKLSLNNTFAEVTDTDTLDPSSTGFIFNTLGVTGSYIYLAIA